MGTGKTVLLEDLYHKVDGGSWLKIRREDPPLRKLLFSFRLLGRNPEPLFADGLESLSPLLIRWHLSLRPRIVTTFHRPRPPFETLVQTRFDSDVAKRLLEFLLGHPATPDQIEAIRRTQRSSGNMRDLIRSLYLSTAGRDGS